MSQRRLDSAATVIAALAHLPFRLPDLTQDIGSGNCTDWRMPSVSLAAPPCARQLNDSEPDRVVVFLAVDGVAVNGTVFLPSPPTYPPSPSNLPSVSFLAPSNGGTVQLPPFSPFDMMQPQSIYSSKGAGASLAYALSACSRTHSHDPAHTLPPRLIAERVSAALV